MGVSRGFGHKTRLFLLCATILGAAGLATAGSALATPRRVAVINLASAQKAGTAAAVAFRHRLARTNTLIALPTGLLATALESEIPTQGPRVALLRSARALIAQAGDARGRFADDEALAYLTRVERILLALVPDKDWLVAMADLNLLSGRILLARPKRDEARALFRLVASLDPTRKALDPAVFTPDEVKLFAEAIAAQPGTARVTLSASYDGASIWLDGKRVGAAPATVTLPAGLHYVAAVFKDHTPEIQKVTWNAGSTTSVSLRLHPMSTDARARGLRRAVLGVGAPSSEAILGAARDAATLAGVDAVALIRSGARGIQIAIYDGRADKLGPWLPEVTPSATLLATLLPPPKPRPKPIVIPPPPPPPPPVVWYRKRWAQALIGGGVAATLVGGFLLNRSGDSGPRMVAPPLLGGF